MSQASSQPLTAVTIKSRVLRGSASSGAVCGSINCRATRARVLFVDPCSPWMARTGYGPAGRSAAAIQPISRWKSDSTRLTNGRKSAIEPSRLGTGNGKSPCGRRKLTLGFSTTDHPLAQILMACPVGSPRSR
ncbi:MAG: hypothetical protein ACHRXM_39070 [Isosphaerales bacterium]